MNTFVTNVEFAQHRLIVSDGVYEPYQDFTAAGYQGESSEVSTKNEGSVVVSVIRSLTSTVKAIPAKHLILRCTGKITSTTMS